MSGSVELFGRGAGKLPTASVMAGDIFEVTSNKDFSPVFWTRERLTEGKESESESRYFVTVNSNNSDILEKISKQVEAAANTEAAVGFFTASITRQAALKMKEKLERFNVTVKLYQVVEG